MENCLFLDTKIPYFFYLFIFSAWVGRAVDDQWPSSVKDEASVWQVRLLNEPPCGKANNVVSEQVRHKPSCTSTEKS